MQKLSFSTKNNRSHLFSADKNGGRQGSLLPLSTYAMPVPKMPFSVRCVTTLQELKEFITKLQKQKWFSFDTETTSINPRRAELVGMSFCWSPDEAWYIPVKCAPDEICLSVDTVLFHLLPYLQSSDYKKIGQNIKYDIIVLKNHGINLSGVVFDTLIASYLLDAGSRRHNLDLLAKKYLDYETIHIKDLIGQGSNQIQMGTVPLDLISAYAAEDAWVVAKLSPILYAEAERQQLTNLLGYVEIPLISVLAQMEYDGIHVDLEKAAKIKHIFESRINDNLLEIKSYAGDKFNPNSSVQLRHKIYNELNLPISKLTEKGEASTNAAVLKSLSSIHLLPKSISDYRQLTKLKGTYIDSLNEHVFINTGRIHASFNQAVTATGRLSSSNPNLQNIPNKTDDGKLVRSLFSATENRILIAADYSQIELRVLAHYSNDPRLLEAFSKNEDIHAIVASQVGGIPLDKVTSTMRKAAKAINFGIVYGQGAAKLGESLGISKENAQAFIDQYFKEYPSIKNFKKHVISQCRSNEYVTTILGRRRFIKDINSPNGPNLWAAERMAVNTVIQGSAADLIKIAMLKVHDSIKNGVIDASMLLQVHDELVFEVYQDNVKSVCKHLKTVMESVLKLNVPILVDIKYGKNWAEMEKYEESET